MRVCGCGEEFLSTPVYWRDPKDIPYVPTHCNKCDEAHGEWLRNHDPLYGRVAVKKYNYDCFGDLKSVTPKMLVTVTPGAKRHARYSPSTFGSREKCAGWMNDNDPSKSTAAADRGTMIHEAIEKDDTSALVAEDDILCAEKCIAYVDKLAAKAGPHKRFRERQVRVLDQFGTVDDLIIAGSTADMTDYKTGYREVPDAEDNPQVQGYVLGVFDEFDIVDTVNVHLLMPRQGVTSTATYTRAKHYQSLKERVFFTIERAKAVDLLFQQGEREKLLTSLNPAPSNCEYCGRKGQCPALHEMALTIAQRYEPQFIIPAELHGSEITDPRVMSQALLIAPIMEEWAKGVKKSALAMRMETGVEIPGFTLGERKGARKIKNAQAAWDVVKDIISPDEFAACADVSMPELENAVASKAPKGKKGATKQQLENQLRDRDALQDEKPVHFLKQAR